MCRILGLLALVVWAKAAKNGFGVFLENAVDEFVHFVFAFEFTGAAYFHQSNAEQYVDEHPQREEVLPFLCSTHL